MYCKKCGKEIADETDVCPHCGAAARILPKEEAVDEGVNYNKNRKHIIRSDEGNCRRTNEMAIAGFICALVSPLTEIFLVAIMFGVLGLIFSIVGMKQCQERNESGYGLAKAGAIIAVIVDLLIFFAFIFNAEDFGRFGTVMFSRFYRRYFGY